MMYVHQITMLYTLNFYSAVCQLYLNKTGWKVKTIINLKKRSAALEDPGRKGAIRKASCVGTGARCLVLNGAAGPRV